MEHSDWSESHTFYPDSLLHRARTADMLPVRPYRLFATIARVENRREIRSLQ
jgi:hypothetical protein